MRELERYGVIARGWHFNEEERVLHVTTDIASIELKLTSYQVEYLKQQFEMLRTHVGREWKDGVLCIPAKEREEGKNE